MRSYEILDYVENHNVGAELPIWKKRYYEALDMERKQIKEMKRDFDGMNPKRIMDYYSESEIVHDLSQDAFALMRHYGEFESCGVSLTGEKLYTPHWR